MMKMTRLKKFSKKYKWMICLIWAITGLVLWTLAGYSASIENTALPGSVYFRAAGICWLMFHAMPVTVAAIIFRL